MRELFLVISMLGFLVLIVSAFIFVALYFLRGPRPHVYVQTENMARYVTGMYFAQQYGVNPTELVNLNHPQAMEERARRLQLEQQVAASGISPPS